ncbi:MAG: glycosyltransferase [Alphaproteobacteria bacterium]|nr:MAG: glycosyltransferase [Alphaproteobacteria bacterium]
MQTIRETWRIPAAKLLRIPDGIDAARFATPPDPTALPGFARDAGDLVVGTVAPLRREKNIGRFLRLIAALRADGLAVRGVVVGDGVERQALEALCRDMGLADRVHFAGFIAAVEKVYGLFDLFAITSETEQLPNGVLQAMAAARAVVGTDVGDVARMVAAINRDCIVPAADETALAAAAARLLRDGDLRARIGAANQAHVAQAYRLDEMVGAYDRAYGEALACVS